MQMLPAELRPAGAYDLVRLGNGHDGGYVVEASSVDDAEILISLGLSDDWSFDKALRSRNTIPIEAYDAAISADVFCKRMLLNIDRPRRFWKSLKTLIDYRRFFQDDVRHHQRFVGYKSADSTDLESVIGQHQQIFFKIDVEGWEYRMLDAIVDSSDRVRGAVIEFHDVDLHRGRIVQFIRDSALNVAHVHGNNFGGVDANGDPLVLEVSFTKQAPERSPPPFLPSPLDMPNDRSREELSLTFEQAEPQR